MKNYTNFTSDIRAHYGDAHRELITFNDFTAKGEKVMIELSRGTDSGTKNSLPRLWLKEGWKDRLLSDYWCLSVCVEDEHGLCMEKYNPTITRDYKINFKWMNEATEENRQRLINEVARRSGIAQ